MARALFPQIGTAILAALSPVSLAYAADVTCYVDSVGGDDSKSSLSEGEAVKSQAKIGSTCTIVQYKRGSVFPDEAIKISNKVKVYTNYGDPSLPLPKFVRTRSPNNGAIVNSYQGGITIDGLYLAGSQSDSDMSNLLKGIGVVLGGNSKLINSEITDCDIGIMLFGSGTLVQNNYVHDLHVSVDAQPGVDANVVGGAEGIFVNGSDNEVAYNSFINCAESADWQAGECDGGATEVSIGKDGASLSGLKIHHNYSYHSCGFFEVSSMFSSDPNNPIKGLFADSEFYNNVSVDSGWLSLLQVCNTDLKNIRWENNTIIQHKGSPRAGMLVAVYTGLGSGMTGGDLLPNSVFWTNNLFVGDGVTFQTPHKNIVQANNLILNASKQDPGFVNLAGIAAKDFDLIATSPAVNAGVLIADHTLDYLNRTIPDSSGKPDIGAFEYGSTEVEPPPVNPFGGGPTGIGGTTSIVAGAGGATVPKTAGKGGSSGGTTSIPSGTGGIITGTGGKTGGGAPSAKGGAAGVTANSSGGAAGAGKGGAAGAVSVGAPGSGGTATARTDGGSKSGCHCYVGQAQTGSGMWIGLLGVAWLALRRRRACR
jgi:MYXO-CTERM domain-containing protein